MSRMKINVERIDTSLSFEGSRLCFTKCKNEDEEVTTFNVTGVIGDDWDGLSSQEMVPEIQSTKTDIVMRMNTPGGFVNDALDIYDALMSHTKNVRIDIVAEAWSAGTILAAAGDEVRIAPAAKYGIHRAWGGMLVVGNSDEMENQMKQMESYREYLQTLDIEIARMVAERSGNTLKQVHSWMIGPDGCDGTEFVGKEAVEAGLCDALIEHKEKPIVNLMQLKAAAQRQSIKLLNKRAGLTEDWTSAHN